MENKQTAVDWFWNKIKSQFEHDGDLLESAIFTLAIAKQKEKQQIMDARQDGHNSTYIGCESGCGGQYCIDQSNEQYYNETYTND